MHHILYTPQTSVRTVRPSPRNCPTVSVGFGGGLQPISTSKKYGFNKWLLSRIQASNVGQNTCMRVVSTHDIYSCRMCSLQLDQHGVSFIYVRWAIAYGGALADPEYIRMVAPQFEPRKKVAQLVCSFVFERRSKLTHALL